MTRATATKGNGNVFRDLGFSEWKPAELILTSSLLQALQETIKSRGWKQVEAAVQSRIDQAKVAKLLVGQMAGFSIDHLVHCLSLLGQDVVVTIRQASRGRRRGTVRTKQSRFLYSILSIREDRIIPGTISLSKAIPTICHYWSKYKCQILFSETLISFSAVNQSSRDPTRSHTSFHGLFNDSP